MPHPVEQSEDEFLATCEVSFTRRGGPGGQHRNKTESAVVLKHLPSGFIAEGNERRSQADNKRSAVSRLRMKLALELREPVSEQTLSTIWRARTSNGKLSVSEQHDDFAICLAIALNAICAQSFDVASAAQSLGVSSSQLVKLLRAYPASLAWVNQAREERALPRFR